MEIVELVKKCKLVKVGYEKKMDMIVGVNQQLIKF